ncbi:MAG: ABC transporter ATP-binding protein [Clostridia bacterium]|nr:ABC transporter ATP-binding protein [Clostridia bacterium]
MAKKEKGTPKPKRKKGAFKRGAAMFWSFLKGYRILTFLTPFTILLDVFIELKLPEIMGDVTDYIMYNAGTASFVRHDLNMLLLKMLGYTLMTLVVGYCTARFVAIASMGFGANMRSAIFNKVQDLSFDNIDRFKIGSLITRTVSDTSRIQSLFSTTLSVFLKGPIMLGYALWKSIRISADMSKMFYYAVPAIVVVLSALGAMAVPLFKQMLGKMDTFNGTLRGNISGIRVVKAFVREDYERDRFETVNTDVAKANIKAQSLIIYISPAIVFIMYACMIFALRRGSTTIIYDHLNGVQGALTYGQLTEFTAYISQVLSSLMVVLMVFVSMVVARASITRVAEIFREEPTINDNDGDPGLTVRDGSIRFDHVSFKYSPEAEENILTDISLSVESGEMLGIIGATGSAKSTLVNLIPRLYDVTEGAVYVGGENVKNYKFKNLRDGVSVVLQQTMLFSGTIKENIRWGDPDATDEQIEEAARAAQAHDFILEKENGYDTELGQGGNTVSGGQRQRLCLARAFVKKPKVLILDDTTSAVDTETDAKIRAVLRTEAFRGITKIIIAQRITSIMDADRIIVMDNGTISGMGTHEELLKTNEIYHEIFVSQQEGVLAQ